MKTVYFLIYLLGLFIGQNSFGQVPTLLASVQVLKNPTCPTCKDGIIRVNAPGMTPRIDWAIYENGNLLVFPNQNSFSPYILFDIVGLGHGEKLLKLKDKNGKATELSFGLKAEEILNGYVETKIACPGESNGRMVLIVTSGGYATIEWRKADGRLISSNNEANGLSGGTYFLKAFDDKKNVIFQREVFLQTSAEIKTVLNIQDQTCTSPGFMKLEISGGVPPYDLMVDGNVYKNLIPIGGSTVFFRKDLTAGKHFFFITDQNGCTKQQEFEVKKVPTLVGTYTEMIKGTSCWNCTDGVVKVSVGGLGQKLYYHVYNSKNTVIYSGSSETNTFNIIGLAKGVYAVEVYNELGCTTGKMMFEVTQTSIPTAVEDLDVYGRAIYPNPVSVGELVKFYGFPNEARVLFVNVAGQRMLDVQLSSDSILAELPTGIYMVTVITKEEGIIFSRRLLVKE